ncbi:OVARIAN TUMOR DOMAIN-containing deubiquitinating enzyme 4-like isoform X2 [Diospyros lotus]|uniref:OVARIAN TUMOR DOMAIN-containing deubiquitinating enzyme 4-like isoform X2 n=1 Tax=Diospyros lotus TaxID=55363 RepID=UPI0022571CC6|nr:OVARIAN TUMOR DOMAIN-containing deubiquitinating enzyme 4-like isoform X2 [Diospyros lotus]
MICSPFSTYLKQGVHLSGCVRRQMSKHACGIISQIPCSCDFSLSAGYSKHHVDVSVATKSYSTVFHFQGLHKSCCIQSCIPIKRNNRQSLMVTNVGCTNKPQKICLDLSFGCQDTYLKIVVPKRRRVPKIKYSKGTISWPQHCASTGLIFGLLVCYSASEPVNAETAQPDENTDNSSVSFSHGKKVYTDYCITGIPGDGRCLFRSVAHGACLRSGKPAPDESLQRVMADELRARVADEFVKRRKETEWFIEGDFDTYISRMRRPHAWGGEPELLMASHVLQMPITVYMHDQDSGGLIAIAEYGQEYGKDNPIQLLYHGFGHYDALQSPGKKSGKSRL